MDHLLSSNPIALTSYNVSLTPGTWLVVHIGWNIFIYITICHWELGSWMYFYARISFGKINNNIIVFWFLLFKNLFSIFSNHFHSNQNDIIKYSSIFEFKKNCIQYHVPESFSYNWTIGSWAQRKTCILHHPFNSASIKRYCHLKDL